MMLAVKICMTANNGNGLQTTKTYDSVPNRTMKFTNNHVSVESDTLYIATDLYK